MAPLKVLICGAGCAGPALALWLSRAGHKVVVVERSPELRTTGAQIDLREQGIDVTKRMGLLDTLRSITVDEAGVSLVDDRGNVLGTIMANKSGQGAQSLTSEFEFMRGDFVQMLYNETRGEVEYIFGTTVERHELKENSVIVHFSSGSSGEFDLLIGADGQGSRTRKAILSKDSPNPYRRFGLHGAYFIIPRVETDTNIAEACIMVGGRMVMRRTHSPTESHVMLFTRDDSPELSSLSKASVETQKEAWHQRFKDIGGETDRFLEAMATAEHFYCQEIVQVRIDTWHKGRVALLGDAAFCPSPFSGFGLNASLIGAYVLAGEICRRPDAPEVAFQNYENTLRPFMEGVQAGVSPFTVAICMPKSWLGVAILQLVARLIFFLRIPELATRFSSEKKGGWSLPDYPELGGGASKAE